MSVLFGARTDHRCHAGRWSRGGVTMNIRWMAVLTGFVVDILLTFFITLLAPTSASAAPDLMQPPDFLLIGLGILATGVGGYVAARMAQTQRILHGFLVGVVGIL